jgi:hypothetical protein
VSVTAADRLPPAPAAAAPQQGPRRWAQRDGVGFPADILNSPYHCFGTVCEGAIAAGAAGARRRLRRAHNARSALFTEQLARPACGSQQAAHCAGDRPLHRVPLRSRARPAACLPPAGAQHLRDPTTSSSRRRRDLGERGQPHPPAGRIGIGRGCAAQGQGQGRARFHHHPGAPPPSARSAPCRARRGPQCWTHVLPATPLHVVLRWPSTD